MTRLPLGFYGLEDLVACCTLAVVVGCRFCSVVRKSCTFKTASAIVYNFTHKSIIYKQVCPTRQKCTDSLLL